MVYVVVSTAPEEDIIRKEAKKGLHALHLDITNVRAAKATPSYRLLLTPC